MFFYKLFGRGQPRQISLFVEGNIGAGKTTSMLLAKKMLTQRGLTVLTLAEDVVRWNRQGLSRDLYEGTVAGSRAFHVLGCLRQYVERARYLHEHGDVFDVVISERHPSTTLEVFETDECVREMFEVVDEASYRFMAPPAFTVYLKAHPRDCLNRIRKRSRSCEKNIALGRLEELELAHDKMMQKRSDNGGLVFEIDCTRLTAEEVAARLCDAALSIPRR